MGRVRAGLYDRASGGSTKRSPCTPHASSPILGAKRACQETKRTRSVSPQAGAQSVLPAAATLTLTFSR